MARKAKEFETKKEAEEKKPVEPVKQADTSKPDEAENFDQYRAKH